MYFFLKNENFVREQKKSILFMYTNFYYTAMFLVVESAFRMSFCFEGYKEDDMFNDST